MMFTAMNAFASKRQIPVPHWLLIIGLAVFISLTGNFQFFNILLSEYPLSLENIGFIVSVALLNFSVLCFFLACLCFIKCTKWIMAITLIVTSTVSYFQDQFGIILNTVVLESILSSNLDEASDLFSFSFVRHLLYSGILPVLVLSRLKVVDLGIRQSFFDQVKISVLSLLFILILIVNSSSAYASFFREHKLIRMYSNPTMFAYSAVKFVGEKMTITYAEKESFHDYVANIQDDKGLPPLVVLVVGETARADNVSLDGYERITMPKLQAREVLVNFSKVSSCGTATAVSVPCMFSLLDKAHYSKVNAEAQANVLDLLRNAGVHVLWRDNNSDSKGVALRVPFEDYKHDDVNPLCDIECRDSGMLDHLQSYVDASEKTPMLIVLHQMGSHGPAYAKRYPKAFETFTPSCAESDLSLCSTASIINAYDNTLLYTDYFLDQVIKFLESNVTKRRTAMIYISDHGESLGEYGVYLHGLPYSIAPEQQTHVPMFAWLGPGYKKEREVLKRNAQTIYSHDNLSHTVLDLFHVQTDLYKPEMSMLSSAR